MTQVSKTQIRQVLAEFRKRVTQASPQQPLFISDLLTTEDSIETVCLQFIKDNHDRRHAKKKGGALVKVQ